MLLYAKEWGYAIELVDGAIVVNKFNIEGEYESANLIESSMEEVLQDFDQLTAWGQGQLALAGLVSPDRSPDTEAYTKWYAEGEQRVVEAWSAVCWDSEKMPAWNGFIPRMPGLYLLSRQGHPISAVEVLVAGSGVNRHLLYLIDGNPVYLHRDEDFQGYWFRIQYPDPPQ